MGNVAIVVAAGAAVTALTSATVGAGRHTALVWARRALAVSAVAGAVAVALLVWALVAGDASLTYVERHSSTATPLPYRVAATWGGMEGSLLLWSTLVAAVFALAASWTSRRSHRGTAASQATDDPSIASTESSIVVVGALVAAVSMVVTWLLASPFDRIDVPTGRGDGLLAVLQHPAMVYHPPLLYLGLALLGPPFAITVGAGWRRRLDTTWRAEVAGWMRAAWLVLGVGIVTGSHWAYAELGWGGFWAWDPVENSSLLPWLAATIAVHGLAAPAGRLTTTAATAIVGAFVLVSVGVAVTRSGSTGSIHAFAESASIGIPLAALAAVLAALGVVATVRAARGDHPGTERGAVLRAPDRGWWLGLHGALVATALAIIAAGTLWPVVLAAWDGAAARTVVRPDYYERLLAPVIALTLVAMTFESARAAATAVPDGATGERALRRGRARLGVAAIAGMALGVAVHVTAGSTTGLAETSVAAIAGGAAVAIASSPVRARPDRVARLGVVAAHLGVAVLVFAAVTASTGADRRFPIVVGQATAVDGWLVSLDGLEFGERGRYEYVRAAVEVDIDGDRRRFAPELRAYGDQPLPTAEADTRISATGDTIVVLESVAPDAESATVVVRTRPFMVWAWLGAVLLLAGGAVTSGRRWRGSAGAPGAAPRRGGTAAPRPAAGSTAGPVTTTRP